MSGPNNIKDKIELAETIFEQEDDQNLLQQNKQMYASSVVLEQLSESEAGRILIKELKEEITKDVMSLIETREGKFLSDLDSHISLLTKLTNAKSRVKAIESWVESLDI